MGELATVADAQRRILAALGRTPAETVAVASGAGRVLRDDVVSTRTVPAFANSSMDGYAICSGDTADGDAILVVIGESRAGVMPQGVVRPGTAMAIMTGAPMPPGADAVVPREQTDDARPSVRVMTRVMPGLYIRDAGEDMKPGDLAVAAGTRLRSHHIAVLAALGITTVAVGRRPRIGLLSTGDELVTADVDPAPGQVVDSNSPALAVAIARAGGDVVDLGIARDTPASVRTALHTARDCDLIVSSAGVSVGDHDHVRDVVRELGSLDLWRIAMRPGKPLAFGSVGATPFIGLPGNPVSSQVTFELFARPAILALQGAASPHRQRFRARLADAVSKPDGLETYHRGVLSVAADGQTEVRLTGAQGSGILRSLADADCLMVIPAEGSGLAAGDTVAIIPLD